jgi:hypothetical protein
MAQGESPLYMRQVQSMLRELVKKHGNGLRFSHLKQAVKGYPFQKSVRPLVERRVALLEEWVDDDRSLRGYIKPGRLIIVDIRDEWMDGDMAMTLFAMVNSVLCLRAGVKLKDGDTNLLVVFDEAHKFAKSPIIRQQMQTLVRERRHLRASVILACQDPDSLPQEIIPMMNMVGVFHHDSAKWNRVLAEHIRQFAGIKVKLTSRLQRGQMLFWAREWYQEGGEYNFKEAPLVVNVRPRASQHGGKTRTAVH